MEARIAEQITTLKFVLEIGQKEIQEAGDRLNTKFENLPNAQGQKEFLKNEAVYLYLKNFWQYHEFLIKKIETENEAEDFQYYIPLTRILFEIYAELLYFVNQTEKSQLGIFVGNYFLYLSDTFHFVAIQSVEIKNEYGRLFTLWSNLLSAENITFPADINLFSYTQLKTSGFNFPKLEQIFKEPYFSTLSDDSFSRWAKDEPSNFYDKYYRSHSNYAHGSFTNQASGSPKTEMFWTIQFMYLISQLMIELCNKKVFNNKFKSDYDQFESKIATAHPKLQELWDEKGKPNV